MTRTVNGEVSFWWSDLGGPGEPRPPLDGSRRADVCIVGAGYTGLWTAYYAKRADPTLDIVVLESRFAGYGASGRNGGWLTHDITGRDTYVRSHGRDAVNAFQRAMDASVDEVVRVAAVEGIDADIHKGGELTVATNPAQLGRLVAAARAAQTWASDDSQLLDAAETAARIRVEGTLAGWWQPHCARIHPARLVRGLARVVEGHGVRIHESTRVREIRPGEAVTDRGTVTAPVVVRATEGFTADLKGQHRTWLPMNSSLIVTEPLDSAVWDELGWVGREPLGDMAHVYMYAQRTGDDRIAIGGRGVPYRFGSRTDQDGSTVARTVRHLTAVLNRLFPSTEGAAIEHAWSGVLGVPRDWAATVAFDRTTGLAWAGGYVGTGVTTANLAGRTLADLIGGRDTDVTHLPWVDHRARRWEIEPLRWLAVQGIYGAYGAADRMEERSGRARTSPLAHVADLVSGRH